MTDIYLHVLCAHYGLYANAPVPSILHCEYEYAAAASALYRQLSNLGDMHLSPPVTLDTTTIASEGVRMFCKESSAVQFSATCVNCGSTTDTRHDTIRLPRSGALPKQCLADSRHLPRWH